MPLLQPGELASPQGLLLPLCASGTCTLREAVIVSSVLRRVSVPVLHSAAALLRLAEMPYSGTTSFFIRVLLDKKYALPYRVVDALVDHFVRFQREERILPVVWHQALLCFVQRRAPAYVIPLPAFVMLVLPWKEWMQSLSTPLSALQGSPCSAGITGTRTRFALRTRSCCGG